MWISDFISFRYHGKDIVFYDSNLKGLYPWKVCEDQVRKTNKEGIFVSVQPKTPSSKEVADALIGSGYAGADTKRIFGPNDLEIFMNKESMTAFNCPGCEADADARNIPWSSRRYSVIVVGQVVCMECKRTVLYRRWKLAEESNYYKDQVVTDNAESGFRCTVKLVPQDVAEKRPRETMSASAAGAEPSDSQAPTKKIKSASIAGAEAMKKQGPLGHITTQWTQVRESIRKHL